MNIIILVILSPVLLVLSCLNWIFNGRPIFFKQKRIGKNGREFVIYKFRTMIVGAEKRQKELASQNEADGPVFKIKNDPRFTKFGKILSHCGLDELPQLWNVIRGEMAIVGPRPLPVKEALAIKKSDRKIRESVLPGIISPWIFEGYHEIGFERWMESDKKYVKNKSIRGDWLLILKSFWLVIRLIINELTY